MTPQISPLAPASADFFLPFRRRPPLSAAFCRFIESSFHRFSAARLTSAPEIAVFHSPVCARPLPSSVFTYFACFQLRYFLSAPAPAPMSREAKSASALRAAGEVLPRYFCLADTRKRCPYPKKRRCCFAGCRSAPFTRCAARTARYVEEAAMFYRRKRSPRHLSASRTSADYFLSAWLFAAMPRLAPADSLYRRLPCRFRLPTPADFH